jgi:hypothetical protein
MTGVTNYSADALLEWLTGKTAMPSKPTSYVALFTVVGTDAGTGFTEVSGGSYARVATAGSDWNAASGTAPSTISNANTITFPAATADWGTIIAWGLYDASSSGNLLCWDFMGAYNWYPFSCTSANPGVLTAIGMTSGSSLANSDKVVLNTEYGGTLPTGLSNLTLYTVAGLSSDTFNLSTTTSSTGDGLVRKVTQQIIPSGVTPSFAAGQLIASAA